MDVYQITYPLGGKKFPSCIIAIGYFDGVHLGHQQVIKRACDIAKKNNLPCGVMTFNPHPMVVINKYAKIDQLTPVECKLKIFKELNIDISYIVNFSKEFANLSPESFIEDFLIKLNAKGVVVGFDFAFGSKGLGNSELLIEKSNGRYSVDVISSFNEDGEKISSTRIRDYLLSGKVLDANRLLGRNYSFYGKVIHGDKRGRTIGFPTANLELLENYLSIKKGVYVVKIDINGKSYAGVMNIGYNPTFVDDLYSPSYEVHIIDFKENIYNQILKIELIEFVRDEKKFNSIEDLKRQISDDVEHAKRAIINMTI